MKKNQPIGFGIVGTGMVAGFHARAIEQNAKLGARLMAVSTRDPTKFKDAADRFGVPCLNWETLCWNSDIDVICICTPSGCHAAKTIEEEDTLAVRLRFGNGAMGTILATTVAPPGFPHRVERYGTQGGVQIEGESVVRWRLADPGTAVVKPH